MTWWEALLWVLGVVGAMLGAWAAIAFTAGWLHQRRYGRWEK